jgi:hypothetical protein
LGRSKISNHHPPNKNRAPVNRGAFFNGKQNYFAFGGFGVFVFVLTLDVSVFILALVFVAFTFVFVFEVSVFTLVFFV